MLTICHLSDTQIRNFQRHAEFRESYEHLYKSLREQKPDIIVLVGDIAHAKTHISPEFVDLCSEYFTELAKIATLVVVPGNHDGNLSNLNRLDALTPIVKALNNKNIHYYKDSGIYPIPGFSGNLVVFSCFDENWPTKSTRFSIPDKLTIGLYHGMLRGALLQNGQIVDDCPYSLDQFLEIVDYLMLGDIHKMQILDHGFRAAYCGSFPQQSYGESTEKGYLLWKIESKDKHDVDFIRLPNVCPFYTITVPDSLEVAGNLPIQPNSKVRVFSRQLTSVEEAELRRKLEAMYEPKDLIFKDDVNAHRQELKLGQGATIEDLVDVGIQEKLIRKFLDVYNLEEGAINKVLDLNVKYDSAVRKEETVLRNIQYKIKKMKWSNIGPYGEDNEFDFSKHKGIVGIFGKNAVGKSYMAVDIPLYTIFNTNSKSVVKNDHLINDRKDSCEAEVNIGVGNQTYKIERKTKIYVKSGKKKGKPVYQGKTDVNFTLFDEDDQEIEIKDGLERSDTDKEIRKVFGIAEDFMATSVAPQWRLLDFIEKRNTERQKILGRYFDIEVFYTKHKLANDDSKDVKGEIRFLEKRDIEGQLATKRASLVGLGEDIEAAREDHKVAQKALQASDTKIEKLRNRIVDVVSGQDEDQIQSLIDMAEARFEEKTKLVDGIIKEEARLKKELISIESQMQADPDLLKKERVKTFKGRAHVLSARSDLGKLDAVVKTIDESIKKFKQCDCKHDPGCCLIEELDVLLAERAEWEASREHLVESVDRCDLLSQKLDDLDDQIAELDANVVDLNDTKVAIQGRKRLLTAEAELLSKLGEEREFLQEKKKKIEEGAEQRKKNEATQQKLSLEQDRHITCVKEEEQLREHLNTLENNHDRTTSDVDALEEDLHHLNQLREEYTAYEYFLKAVGKEGLPRTIVHNNLGIINAEISKILSGKVDFDIDLETSESGKEIEIVFRHDKAKPRKIEVCSGMEKSLSALAIRVALINVTTLPKSNIFALDEPFGYLEEEYKDAAIKFLQHIKTYFDTVVLITHDGYFKDIVDHVVQIERDEQGFARR